MTSKIDEMLAGAKAVMAKAYAPYSNFKVGAVALGGNGQLYAGCNVENAAYPLGTCAEAGAISAMVADGETRLQEIVVMGSGAELVTPCGGCRQKIREFGVEDTPIHICDPELGVRKTVTLGELLPLSFGPENLS